MTIEKWLEGDQLGIDIWNKKYRWNGETFDEFLDRVSLGYESIRKLILEKKFLPGGRILAGVGTQTNRKICFSNCSVTPPPQDNIESIFETAKLMARSYAAGEGCGTTLDYLSPKGSIVNNAAKETTGAISFANLYSTVTELIGQEGRRGALLLCLSVTHPDILEFIQVKDDLTKVTYANLSVKITNDFMKAYIDDTDWEVSFTRPETGQTIARTIPASLIMEQIAEHAWKTGEPGILFIDTINSWHAQQGHPEYILEATNPCVVGDTLILTKQGYKKIEDVVDQTVELWNGHEFSNVDVKITGVNQEIFDINFSDGSILSCTPYHGFYLKDKKDKVEAKDLMIGDKLQKWNYPIIEGIEILEEKQSYTQGFFSGDGSTESSRDRKSIWLYDKKKELLEYLDYRLLNECENNRLFLTISNDYFDKDFVPNCNYTITTRLNWLAGLIDSDGTLNDKGGSIGISSTNNKFLQEVKFMLSTIGCFSTLELNKKAVKKLMPDGKGGQKEYNCQDCFRLLINASNVKKLVGLGLQTHRVKLIANPSRDAGRFIKITSITKRDTLEPKVFCFNEPLRHMGYFNGVATSQCGEQPLINGGVCNLFAINVAEYTVGKTILRDELIKDLESIVEYGNEILDVNIGLLPLEIQRTQSRDWRQIGIGIMGLADALIKAELTYGSQDAIGFANELMRTITNAAFRASALEANDQGSYPKYKRTTVLKSDFVDNLDGDTKDLISQYGLRNAALITVAPTGSIATMLGISGGCEPMFALEYERTTKSLHGGDYKYIQRPNIVSEYLNTHQLSTINDLPAHFITSHQIHWRDRIDMQRALQEYVDSAISSTINLPEETTIKEIEELYTYAWNQDLKGLTVFRDNCYRTGILNITPAEEKSPVMESFEKEYPTLWKPNTMPRGAIIHSSNNLYGKKRKLQTGCGTMHVEAWFDPDNGELREVFFNKGSEGGCERFMQSTSRLASLALRGGVNIAEVLDQLDTCKNCSSYITRSKMKGDTSPGTSCPTAIAKSLKDMQEEMDYEMDKEVEYIIIPVTEGKPVKLVVEHEKDWSKHRPCPECGNEMMPSGGCTVCPGCGFTHCD